MVRRLRAFGMFWYDFIVGDDWRVAVSIAVALAATVAVDRLSGAQPWSWWLLVAVVAAVLPLSIHRATRRERGPADQRPSSSST
ncbi:MAG: hypothetical protein JWQ86_463 [Mycobacterium sp.]|jgi:1,4-dihydroxy-2-naphthoate octaprenyltransferase|nr:hypothetical protein [Mycobacterium sp.]MDT5212578.1 hypothetical protein [Mycobacterium sp.]MDT5247665.1 hypothetical protein [Mycobacterium sp.]MDT7757706.1 hypothetical protein [Mycobacterium sp.]